MKRATKVLNVAIKDGRITFLDSDSLTQFQKYVGKTIPSSNFRFDKKEFAVTYYHSDGGCIPSGHRIACSGHYEPRTPIDDGVFEMNPKDIRLCLL